MFTFALTRPEGQAFVRTAVRHAFAAAELKQGAAASMMGIKEPQLTRQLEGLEHLSLQRLVLINDATFWLTLCEEFKAHFALVPVSDGAEAALNTLIVRMGEVAETLKKLPMAKAELRDEKRARRSA